MGGLRPGAALGLRWEDLNFDAVKIHVQRSFTRRGVKALEAGPDEDGARSRRVVAIPGT